MTYAPALAQRWFPGRTWRRECVVVGAGALLVALLAQVSVPLAPVPVTCQTLGVLFVGGWLGFRRASAALLLYLTAGTAGMPVFALASGGPGVLAGPTGGYLLGFIAAAGTAGLLAEHGFLRTFPRALLVMLLASLPIYAFGLAWLAAYVPHGTLLESGLLPFFPFDLAKAALAAALLRGLLGVTARSGR
jgi:biotin transport system substrate-specific component